MDLRETDQMLPEGDRKTRAILKALPDLMFVLGRDGTYLDYYAANPSDLFVPPEQLLGKRIQDLLPPDVVAAVEPKLQQVAASGEAVVVEYHLPMPDGPGFFEARMVQLEPDKVLCIVRNVTDRKRMEKALEESRRFGDRLAQTFPNVAFLYDLETRRNVYVNDRSAAIIGYTAEEVLEMGDQFVPRTMHPDDLGRLASLGAEYARAKDGDIIEHLFRFRHKNGDWRWIHRCASVFARSPDGRPRQILGTATDVTVLKETEQELHALSTRLLTIQDDERRRIARELHDGTAQTLFGIGARLEESLRLQHALPPTASHALADCQWLCDEALKEVRLLTYLLHPPVLDDVGLVASLRWFSEGFAARSGIDVSFETTDALGSLPPDLERDLFRIAQEALVNVVRHSGSQKAVVRLEGHTDRVELAIEDFGHGMPTSSDTSDSRRYNAGVGIPGMRERLRHLGGRLDIASGTQGTTVTATVPIQVART